MKPLQRKLVLVAAAAVAVAGGSALPTDVHASIVSWTGPAQFDQASITFTPFMADTLVSVTGDGAFHSHTGELTTMTLSINLDEVWTDIFSASTSTNIPTTPLSSLIDNVTFSSGMVSGLMLDADIFFFSTFHFFTCMEPGCPTAFNFDTVTAVPLPAALPLFLSALAGLGFMGWRKKQRGDA